MARPVGGALAQHRILFGSVCAATLDGQPWPQVARATIRQLTTTDDGRRAALRLYQGQTRVERSAITAAAAAGQSGAKRAGGAATRREACAAPADERAATAVPEGSGWG
jgi:hypothetical protein